MLLNGMDIGEDVLMTYTLAESCRVFASAYGFPIEYVHHIYHFTETRFKNLPAFSMAKSIRDRWSLRWGALAPNGVGTGLLGRVQPNVPTTLKDNMRIFSIGLCYDLHDIIRLHALDTGGRIDMEVTQRWREHAQGTQNNQKPAHLANHICNMARIMQSATGAMRSSASAAPSCWEASATVSASHCITTRPL